MTKLIAVKFMDAAADDWRESFPHLPPGPELVLYMEEGPCSSCGEPAHKDGDLGGIDVQGVDDKGVIHGPLICQRCMEEEQWTA